tara:strand:+ start:1218 stop:1688 length:471 start_codon:yes stop_codon:yes gene_type:complete
MTEEKKNKVGAPRTVTPEKEELIELGKDLVAWALDTEQELRYHLNQWYTLKHGFTKDQWDCMLMKPEFKAYYKKAKVSIASRYVDSSIHPSIAQRFLRLYFPDLAKEENELLKFKSQLAKEENEVLENLTQLAEIATERQAHIKEIADLKAQIAKN